MMGLFDFFKPAWMSDNKEKALKAVEKLTIPADLALVVEKALDKNVRKTAVEKLTDIALHNSSWKVRLDCVEYLTDRESLLRVAKSPRMGTDSEVDSVVSAIALSAETERMLGGKVDSKVDSFLSNRAENKREHWKVLCKAVEKLSDDREALLDIALHAKDGNLSYWVIDFFIKDELMLVEIAKNAEDRFVQGRAETKLEKIKKL